MVNRFPETNLSEFDVGGDRQDELFDVLSNRRRRLMLRSLETAEKPVSVGELAMELVAWESGQPVLDRSGDEREAIEISLVHNHLPKMAEAGFVKYDDAQQGVTLAGRTDELQIHLQTRTSD